MSPQGLVCKGEGDNIPPLGPRVQSWLQVDMGKERINEGSSVPCHATSHEMLHPLEIKHNALPCLVPCNPGSYWPKFRHTLASLTC